MKRFLYKIWSMFITQFGNIKVFKFPMFFVYDPSTFKIDGQHVLEALRCLEPGDIILRGFDNYLDGYFIDDPNGYSHGGIYIGDDKIVHAVAPHVCEIHVLDFMQCDRICILRPSKYKKAAIAKAKKFVQDKIEYDYMFQDNTSSLYCFELCALAYEKLNVQKIDFKKFFGLLRRNAYLADSFRENADFKIVLECNPKHGVDTLKEEHK